MVHTDKMSIMSTYTAYTRLVRSDMMLGNEAWEFIPAPNGQCPYIFSGTTTIGGFHPAFISVYDGRTVRKGEKSKLIRSWMALETDPKFNCLPH